MDVAATYPLSCLNRCTDSNDLIICIASPAAIVFHPLQF